MPKTKIKFLEDVEVRDHNDEIEFEAKAGSVKSLEDASANRWIRRGVATTNLKDEKPAADKAEKADKKTDGPDALKSS